MASATLEITDKQLARNVLDRLPDTSTLREILNEIALLAALRKSEAQYEAGQFVSHEEAMRRAEQCLSK